jgi:hypothetical protein
MIERQWCNGIICKMGTVIVFGGAVMSDLDRKDEVGVILRDVLGGLLW